jgi:hypothetical protein
VNPYVLTFRGNVLTRLNRWADAVVDYEAASDRFIGMRDIARYSDARADLALALYQLGNTEDAVKVTLFLHNRFDLCLTMHSFLHYVHVCLVSYPTKGDERRDPQDPGLR